MANAREEFYRNPIVRALAGVAAMENSLAGFDDDSGDDGGNLAGYDDALLADLLAAAGPDFTGTGYDQSAVDAMLAAAVGPVGPAFDPADDAPRLDQMAPRVCPRCGYDVANNPDGIG